VSIPLSAAPKTSPIEVDVRPACWYSLGEVSFLLRSLTTEVTVLAKLRIGVLASGRGSNLKAIIDAIDRGDLDVELAVVISDVADAKALEIAREAGVDALYIDPEKKKARMTEAAEQRIIDELQSRGVELIALAGFMRILSPGLVGAFKMRIMNIHPSLLPSFPGLRVQKKALDYGVKFSGCTVHFVDEGVDTGPIIVQAAVPIEDDDTVETLSARILKEEHRIYAEAIRLFAEGRLKIDGRRVTLLPEATQTR
jgi:phosphoribosylglycinamide formyltransferase-1